MKILINDQLDFSGLWLTNPKRTTSTSGTCHT